VHILITNMEHYLDRPGGAQRLAWDEALYFAAAGHQVTVLAAALKPNAPEVERNGDICLLRYKLRDFHPADPRRASAHQNAACDILRTHVKDTIDVVHGHVPLTYLAACDLYQHHALTLYTIHSPATMEMDIEWPGGSLKQNVRRWFGLPLLKRMENTCLRRSSVVCADSDFTRQQMIRIHGRQLGSRIHVIPGWVDLQRFNIVSDRNAAKIALGWPLEVPVLFTLRRLVQRMGLDRLVRAVGIVRDRGQKLRLFIGGDGPLRQELVQLVQNLNLGDSIQFLGRVPDSELPTMYGACDAFVLPTAELECFGLIALEALACGRPVLATPVAAIPELLSNFDRAWLASAADEESIARLIGAFLSGHLPMHSPAEVRRRTEELYSQDSRLAQVAAVVLGSRGGASALDALSPSAHETKVLKDRLVGQ
jgi:glycosyltransferase involved in cell wall biosynthesis